MLTTVATAWFERISANDAQQLATDVGPVPMNVGALVVLDPGPDITTGTVRDLLAERLARIPRLRQRVHDTPVFCGRQVWVDDPRFDVEAHLESVVLRSAAEPSALLEIAVAAVNRPLPRSRPLWRAVIVTGSVGRRIGLVLVFHHVVADGIGGLAVLAGLVDRTGSGAAGQAPEAEPRGPAGFAARPMPSGGALFADAALARLRSVGSLPRSGAIIGAALAELGRGRPRPAPRTSLNKPAGPHRRAAVASTGLAEVRREEHRHGATVNDIMLLAVADALAEVLRNRGEAPDELVVSVPVSARPATEGADLGNRAGVMPVRVPLPGPADERLRRIAAATAGHKGETRGASAAVVAPVFRLLAAVGLFRPMIERQRLVNTFLTNVPGPARHLTLAGAPIGDMIPITIATGNVTVAFAVFSYAGTLSVTVVWDPDRVPEGEGLAAALQRRFDRWSAPGQQG